MYKCALRNRAIRSVCCIPQITAAGADPEVSSGHKSDTEPWLVGHHVILAHASAADIYRKMYKDRHGGQIGITLNGDWAEPWDDSPESGFPR